MSTTEPERWQALLNQVASLSPEVLQKFLTQDRFDFLGQQVSLGTAEQKRRWCTAEGLQTQLAEFPTRTGIVYYVDEATMSMVKTAFVKAYEEQWGSSAKQ